MYSLGRVARVGSGVGIAIVAGVVLSACTAQQDSANGGQSTPTAPTATATTATQAAPADATTSAPATKPAPTKTSAPANACASATKATLEAALKADKKMSGALVIDEKGLQRINCVAPWAFAHFTNDIDGGRILFNYRNGTWVPRNAGTGELCESVPAAIAKQICS
ncbi:hypothetical protein [Amycolatopsis sp. cmx-4-68]|uniref:hypothetical protein n=1 Tax=Amycolatopsis sp. cmx-4-68 TaxID=2790938 RepID=UPI00397C3FCB